MVPLHIAAKKLLKGNALVNLKTVERGYTPLMYACDNLNIECVKYLMENGVDVQAEDNENKTVLYHAVCTKSLPLVVILKYKPELNTSNKDSLRTAVETQSDIAKSLREYGILFNSDVRTNPLILLHAIENGNIAGLKQERHFYKTLLFRRAF